MEEDPSPKPFRLLELPPEVRWIIYSHYYSCSKLLLEYSEPYRQPNVFHSDILLARILNTRGENVDRALHQVSRQLALEATPIWHERSTHLTVRCDSKGWTSFGDLLPGHVCGNLASRLVTLKLVSVRSLDRNFNLELLLKDKDYPNLRYVDVDVKLICNVEHEDVENSTEAWLQLCMSTSPEGYRANMAWLEKRECNDFVHRLRQRHGKDASVTSTLWIIAHGPLVNLCEEKVSGTPCLDNCYERHMRHELKIKFNIEPDQVKFDSKTFRSHNGVRGRWTDDMDKPEVTTADGGNWEQMKLSTDENGKDIWVAPWTHPPTDVEILNERSIGGDVSRLQYVLREA